MVTRVVNGGDLDGRGGWDSRSYRSRSGREVVNVVAMVVAVVPVVVVLVGHPEAVVAGVLGWSSGW